MDRSPTPERPKRAAPKRARVSPSAESGSKEEKDSKENKAPGGTEDNDVDVGVLLASLPSQSLLPLLTSLLSVQPSLKSIILPLIPRPTLETALQALAQSARKLRDAYPYSTTSQPGTPTLGFGFGNTRPVFGAFGKPPIPQPQSAFSQNQNGGMRESYIVSRLRPHITEFVAACMSYMPYFSYVAVASQSASASTTAQSHSTTLQSIHKEHIHPSETYQFLAALTEHFMSQPPLTQSSLGPLLLPRLSEEWKAWVHKLDESVNRQGGMFAAEVVRKWESGLETFASSQGEGAELMRSVRDLWISKVGWFQWRECFVITQFGTCKSTREAATGVAWLANPSRSVFNNFTRPEYLRVHLLPAHLVRDNSSFHGKSVYRKSVPRVPNHRSPRNAKTVPARPFDSLNAGSNDESSPLAPPQKTAVRVNSTLERARSRKSLYKNLLRLLSSPRTASLPILLDYHELHHGLRSVDSYNLLISLAIRHVSHGVVQFLLNGMTADKIPGNLETEKLKTRWFVRSGLWEHAWFQVTAAHPKTIPLSLWLEFFHGTKRTARNTAAFKSPEARFQTLMQNLPVFLPNEVKGSVRAVRVVVRAMLSLNRPQSALTLALRYFNGLPRHVNVKWTQQCVAVIDALIAYEAKKRGLLDFYTARRKLNLLLAIHPSFRPTPKTLYLLLGTLRQAKKCGTVSWQTLTKFKTRWGPQVEDRRVRRRVASYAVVERRLEIFDKVFDAERRSRMLVREAGPTEQPQPIPSTRKAFREMFPRHGYEERLWKSLSIRALKVKLQLQHAQNDRDRVIST
ncbi:Tethering factor for nuclear proteasome STS1 [Mycena venus]|uniref:Tethering factor for nuclear proteasome STS1 n=1 Tax=Mycena venus TaxID=2733690 RepID=A0A8H6XWY2_9AGAR|nr:Tethering factor for nuclear proteasome STS1 [Mycena venus]